jgi:alkaline phosphatase D
MNLLNILLLALSFGCASHKPTTYSLDANPGTEYTAIVQLATSDNQTSMNIIRGRYMDLEYKVELSGNSAGTVKLVKTVNAGKNFHRVIDKIFISDLEPNVIYSLIVKNKKFNEIVEVRHFSTLNRDKKNVQFVVGSCISDNPRYQHVRERIWEQVFSQHPDFILLLGDNVYVDDLDLVERSTVTENDLWQRYFDSIRSTPLFFQKRLVPVLATWDDHDFGANNSDKFFKYKVTSKKVFQAFFGGEKIANTFEYHKDNIYSQYIGFGQRFILLDNRYFRDHPGSKDKNAYLGLEQNKWFNDIIKKETSPTWIVSGGQFFSPAFKLKNGKQVNESFLSDYKESHSYMMKTLKESPSPVTFLSGDVHFSEILKIEPDWLGYETHELTSSPMHGYIFRANSEQGEFFENPRRVKAVKDYNFLYVDSSIDEISNEWIIKVKSIGPKQPNGFFDYKFSVKK